MVQALLNSIKGMLGTNATQTKEFKMEAVKNNRNVFSAIKDISRMFSSQSKTEAKQSQSLASIESNTSETSAKVDRVSVLMQQSITVQTQMLEEIKNLASIIGKGEGQSKGTSFLGMAGAAALGLGAGLGLDQLTNLMGGKNSDGSIPSGDRLSGAGSSTNATEALNFFKSKGWSEEQAAGIVGNLQAESTKNLDPYIRGDGGKAFGIAQWHSDRQAIFENTYGKPITKSTFQEQLEFIQWELENTEAAAAEKLRQARTPEEAAYIIDRHYERSAGAHTKQRINNAVALMPEKDDASAPAGSYQTAALQPKENPMGGTGGSVTEKQRELAGVRKLPLSDNLKRVLQQAASAAGVDVVVYSGGQAAKGTGGPRTGSTRHDNGNAADLYLTRNGRKLSDTNPEDRAIMAKFVSAAVAAGATGVGAGHGYMGPSNIHVGFGKQATWGGAPWIKQAASGVYNNQDLQAQGGGGNYGGGGAGAGSGGDIFGGLGSALGMLGMGGIMGGDLMSIMSAFFGLPIGQMLGAGGMFNQQGGQNYAMSDDTSEETESVDSTQRTEEVPPHASKAAKDQASQKEQATVVESDYRNYEGMTSQIQMAALEELSRSPVVIEKKPETSAYTTSPMQEPPTAFGAAPDSRRETRASWAPRIAVLRPGDEAKNLTWAARIAPNLA